MLNGIDPVIIFQFKKLLDDVFIPELGTSNIPIVSSIPTFSEEPPIPVYLSEKLTGLFIDTEDKNIDIQTDTETLSDGTEPQVKQKGINSVVRITIQARKDSLGLSLLSAMSDIVFEKLTSQEYSISYLHGPTTIFRALLNSFSINQTASNELVLITIELTKGKKDPTKTDDTPVVQKQRGTTPSG